MPVKYSTTAIVYDQTVRSDTSANLRADLDTILTGLSVARAAVTSGFKYTMQSPDGLKMKIWVQDLGDSSFGRVFIRITVTSFDETYTAPYANLQYGASLPTYEVWCNVCQFFAAPLGVVDTGSCIGCGVLSLPVGSGPCTVNGSEPMITDLWWCSSGEQTALAFTGQSFRRARYDDTRYALYYNGISFDVSSGFFLNMMPLCSTLNVDYGFGNPAEIKKYSSNVGMNIDTLLALGTQIYGQLWDCFTYTLPISTVDTVMDLEDTDSNGNPFPVSFTSWNYRTPDFPTAGRGTLLGTLMLLISSPAAELLQNFSYVCH